MNFPILSSLILLPSIGAFFLFFTKSKKEDNKTVKYVALFTSLVTFFLSIYLVNLIGPTNLLFVMKFVSNDSSCVGGGGGVGGFGKGLLKYLQVRFSSVLLCLNKSGDILL